MILVQVSFDVPEKKIKEFLDYSTSTLKKNWEALRCKSYTVYRSVGERIRDDQVIGKNRIVEQLVFDSIEDVKYLFDFRNLNPEQQAAALSYDKRFHATNMQTIILERV
nr:hypothetical protein [Candidatus Njordarchaeum guaymaensis]